MTNVKLSIIMPLYNVANTVRLALDSIFMQNVNFDFEVLAVDDASTDNTLEILQEYAKQHKEIKIIKHEKNSGNAIAFYNALCQSRGDYFCVLDGDDYYTVKNKLQKQVDFLDNDTDARYTAVSHKYLRVDSDFNVFDDPQLFIGEKDWSYLEFLAGKFYSHTTTYMYRNIFRDQVPEKFQEPLYRGDNPRTFMHMLYTKGRVKQLNFVGSVYFYNGNGIWSQTSAQAQLERNIAMLEELGSNLSSQIEKQIWNRVVDYRRSVIPENTNKKPQQYFPPEHLLNKLYSLAGRYGFKHQDFVFKQVYKSEFIDSFCESLGFVEMVKRGFRPSAPLSAKKKHILITVSKLTSTGGGVYNEIKDIINMYPNHNVYILWTDVNEEQELDAAVKNQLAEFKNLTCIYGQTSTADKISNLCDKIIAIAPSKIYHYCGHNNVYLTALIQSMLAPKNICVFSFDHGFSLGLDNTNYDTYITKRPMDYEILYKQYGNKVIYMPCWNADKIGKNKYKPFDSHKNLITASAAARYYKLSSGDNGYTEIIARLLQKTGGKHIHYGPIPEDELKNIKQTLACYNVPDENFVNIAWAENLAESMHQEHVDVFIEPFPTVSYKITLDVLSAGIPVIAHKSYLRMGITDFLYQNHMEWNRAEDFIETLANISKQDLQKHSELSRQYYEQNHSPKVLTTYFTNETEFEKPRHIPFWDNKLIDIDLVSGLLEQELDAKATKYTPAPQQPSGGNSQPTPVRLIRHSKFKRFIQHFYFDRRFKQFVYGLCLIVAQIPVLDLLIRSPSRQKLLEKIKKDFR